ETIAALRPKLLRSLEPASATSCLCSIWNSVLHLHPVDSSPDLYFVTPEHSEPQLCHPVLWLGSLHWMMFEIDCLFQQGVVEHVWKMNWKMMVNNADGLRHLTSKQEDPLCFERNVPTSFCSLWHVSHVASDKHTTDHSWSLSILCYSLQMSQIYPIQAQENEVALDAEQLLFLAGGQDNAIDDDVDEQLARTAQTMFMANLSSANPVTDEAGPSYNLDILSKVQDHDHYQDVVCAHHEEHVMHDSVQLNHAIDSHADYTSDSNMIPYDQYVKDNEVPVVHSNVLSVPNNSFMMIYNDMCEPHAQSVSNPSRNTVVENSLTAELATYKEQVKLYERRAKFELTERE
nr:hypothetical protein [Tanacetum cinerariifolium]